MNKKLATALRLSALSLALLAAGCGGGGSDSGSPDNTGATRSVQGTAAKGIIKGGLVQVYSLNAQGQKSAAPIATATTGSDGTFTVDIPKDVLLFVVEVKATAGATMADEATGADIPVPTNMVLRNIVTLAADAGSYTGTVSPLTELAVKTAEKASGGLTAANIAQAKAGVRTALGFDPETVKPINANSAQAAGASDEQKTQALVLAAISQMAKDGALGCAPADITCVVDSVANSATLTSNSMSLGSIGSQLETATKAVAADATINKTGKTTVTLPPAIKEPVSVPPVVNDNLQSAKTLFSSLRTNFNAIAASESALEARADLVQADFDKMVDPVDSDLLNWVATPTYAIDYFTKYKAGIVTSPQTTTRSGAMGETCIIFSDAAGSITSVSKNDALNIGCFFNYKPVSFVTDPQTGTTTFKRVVQLLFITPGASNEHTYRTRTRKETIINGTRDRNLDATVGTAGTGTITYAPGTAGNDFKLVGQLPARTDDAGVKVADYETWDLHTTRTVDAAGAKTYAITANMSATLADQVVGKLSINQGSQLRTFKGEDFGDMPGIFAVQEAKLSITGESGASAFTGTVDLNNWAADKEGMLYAPTFVKFTGEMKQAGQPFFSGSLQYQATGLANFDSMLPQTDENFLAQTLTLSGSIAIPNRPALALTLAASNGKAGAHTAYGQYNDGSSVVNFNLSRKAGTSGDMITAATISSTSGVSFSVSEQDLNNADPSVDVMKNSAKVAKINLKTGLVSYSDGTFESLN